MTKLWTVLLTGLLGVLAPGIGSSPAQMPRDARNVLSAIVTVRTEVPSKARTAKLLGERRRGSGVVIDDAGHILTIGYLLIEADLIEVRGADGRRISATLVANDMRTGFGLLRTDEPLDVAPMPFGNSSALAERTELIIASDSTAASVRPTLVTSRREFAGYWEYLLEDAIFTAPPHPRYAGAALIGSDGALLGIGSLLVNDALPGHEALAGNMFVPIDHLKPILDDLIRNGRTRNAPRPWLGVFTEEFRDRLVVVSVAPDGPAEQAGVRENDLILKVAGRPIEDQADFYRKVWALGDAGTEIPLTLLQGAETTEVAVRSADRRGYFRMPLPRAPLQST